MEKCIIGIPVFNDLESFKSMIHSLIDSTEDYDKIVIVESGSTDGTKEYCDHLKLHNEKIEVIHTKKEGALKAMNRLFEMAVREKSDLFVTQTDVLFPKLYKRDWLSMMRTVAKQENCGAITSINGGGMSGPDYIDGFFWLGGWCTYFTYRALKSIGGYDENYPLGFGVDVDHTYRMRMAGFQIYQINYWVDHHQMNNRSHDKDENAKKEAGRMFRKKWRINEKPI